MGKKTYLVNGNYYVIDDENGAIKKLIAQDEPNIPVADLLKLVQILAAEGKAKTPED